MKEEMTDYDQAIWAHVAARTSFALYATALASDQHDAVLIIYQMRWAHKWRGITVAQMIMQAWKHVT